MTSSWLEVSLTVNGELAEAVADVLARFAPGGVVTEQGVRFVNAGDEGCPGGPVTVSAYLRADDQLQETRRKLEESLYYLGMIQPLPAPTFRSVADQNWMEAWKAHYQPIPVGKRLVVVPTWMESPDARRVAIKIDPGMAFGTGTHPSTQLCLELLEQFYTQRPRTADGKPRSVVCHPSSVIDIGCGSGILSIAALKLGAESALGVDIDAAALTASRQNAEANGIPPRRLLLGLGSVAEVLEGKFALRQAPLVLANILAPVIVRLLEAGLARLKAPGGALVLSGVLAEQEASLLSAAQVNGLKLSKKKKRGDWVALQVG